MLVACSRSCLRSCWVVVGGSHGAQGSSSGWSSRQDNWKQDTPLSWRLRTAPTLCLFYSQRRALGGWFGRWRRIWHRSVGSSSQCLTQLPSQSPLRCPAMHLSQVHLGNFLEALMGGRNSNELFNKKLVLSHTLTFNEQIVCGSKLVCSFL